MTPIKQLLRARNDQVMLINVKVIPKASRNLVKEEKDSFKIYLTKPAYDGLANKQLVELLAEYLKIKKYQIDIIKGEKSRNKIIRIQDV